MPVPASIAEIKLKNPSWSHDLLQVYGQYDQGGHYDGYQNHQGKYCFMIFCRHRFHSDQNYELIG